MPEQLQKIVQPVKSRWDALTKDQKIKLVAAVAIVLIAIALTLFFTLRTRYVELTNDLTSTTRLPIEGVLDSEGIANRATKGGTAIEVDEKKVLDAKMLIETDPSTSSLDFTYDDAMESITMGTTDNTARVAFRRAKETDIARVLERFSGVVSAKVMLEIPDTIALFTPTNNQEKSRASANLVVDAEVPPAMGKAMARTILRAVEGLEMENIEIYDQNGNTIYSGVDDTIAATSAGSAAELQALERATMIQSIRNSFMPQYFPDAQVLPNLIYDNVAETVIEKNEYAIPGNADAGLVQSQVSESSSGQNTSPDDAPGTDANNQQQPGYVAGTGDESSFDIQKDNTDYLYDFLKTTERRGPSQYNREESSISVVLSRFVYHSQEQMQLDDPTFTALDWNAFKNNTQSTLVANDPSIATHAQTISLATGIPVERVDVTIWEVPIFEDFIETPIDIPLIIALSLLGLLLLMLAYALIRRQKMEEEEEEAEPELSVEDLLVSTQLEEAKEEAEKLEEIDYAKESEIKKQIEKFVNEKPEAVAALLRNWLNTEEW